MFDRSAYLYDAIYDAMGKDYESEAGAILAHIRSRRPDARSLLDVACGTGRHLEFLSQSLACVGIDINPLLLDVARLRCPRVRFVEADMVSFDLGETFDTVTCLFSSIGYVRTSDRLAGVLRSMAAHLNPGGIVLVEPWFTPDRWTPGIVQVVEAEHEGAKAVRVMRSAQEDDIAVLDTHYVVASADGVKHFVERHELGLFTLDEYAAAFEAAGLAVEVDPDGPTGRGLITGLAA